MVKDILPFNRAGAPAWWLNGKILKRTTFGLAQIKLLNLLVPFFRRIDHWNPLPPLSLIAIFEKPRPAETRGEQHETGDFQLRGRTEPTLTS
jgi:hypothetical protein